MTRNKKFTLSLVVPDDNTLSEALELSLIDHILELEEKIFHGCLGALKVKVSESIQLVGNGICGLSLYLNKSK